MNVASKQSIKGKLMFDEPMSKHTSWRLGGPADRYYVPSDLQDLQNYLADLSTDLDILWVGLGSNMLVRDGGFRGQVIAPLNALNEIHSVVRNWQSSAANRGLQAPIFSLVFLEPWAAPWR